MTRFITVHEFRDKHKSGARMDIGHYWLIEHTGPTYLFVDIFFENPQQRILASKILDKIFRARPDGPPPANRRIWWFD